MVKAMGRLDMSHARETQADRMVRDIWAWIGRMIDEGREMTYPFPASELHRRIGRVVYGGELRLTMDGVAWVIDRKAVLEGLP